MRWGYVQRPGLRIRQRLQSDSRLVHRHRVQARAVAQKSVAGPQIARFLQRDQVAAIHQYLRAQLQRLLRAVNNDDLFRPAIDRPRSPQIACECFAQRLITFAAVRIIQHLVLAGAAMAQQQPAPFLKRKMIHRRAAVFEVE